MMLIALAGVQVGAAPCDALIGSQRSPHGERQVGAGLRHALGHDVVVPLPLATIRRPDKDRDTPLKGKPETG